jgi:glycerol-3-phosphate dehydrogenase
MEQPVLILGAGINGAAIAREMLLNGVPVWIVDHADVASGTTAYSSRLIHGGLRYLEHGEFDLVRESLVERGRLLRLAPQFVKPLRLYIPTENRVGGFIRSLLRFCGLSRWIPFRGRSRGEWLVRMGLRLYDTTVHDPRTKNRKVHAVSDAGDNPEVPHVNGQRYRKLCSYTDAQVRYPERLVMAFLEDARQLAIENRVEFRLWNYCRARLNGNSLELIPACSQQQGVVTGADVRPLAACKLSAVVNATGSWVDLTLNQLQIKSRRLMGGTKGSHLVTRHPVVQSLLKGQGIYAEAEDGRPVFLLPCDGATLIGTTEIPFEGDPAHVRASEEEIEYLLAATRRILGDIEIGREDVEFHYRGVRPLPYVEAGVPASTTRRHAIEQHDQAPLPFFSVIGGKLTTCRSLAEEVTAKVMEQLGLEATNSSDQRVVPGGADYPLDSYALSSRLKQEAVACDMTREQLQPIWNLVGSRTQAVLQECMHDESYGSGYIQVVSGVLPVPLVRWFIRHEFVTSLSDLVERRLMLLQESPLTVKCLRELAKLMVAEGVISPEAVSSEVNSCIRELKRYGKTVHP